MRWEVARRQTLRSEGGRGNWGMGFRERVIVLEGMG